MHGGQDHLFDVPIYFQTSDQHAQTFEKARLQTIEDARQWGNEFQEHKRSQSQLIDPPGWYIWFYNDITGWIAVRRAGPELRGCLYHRCIKGRKPIRTMFRRFDDVLIVDWMNCKSSSDVYEAILSELRGLKDRSEFQRRYVCVEGFALLGRFVDWLGLLNAR